MKSNDEVLRDILARLNTLNYVKPESIPGIDLYMDQVTTFMEQHLQKAKRAPQDKVLTKTMINNYAKNNLLPPPDKKKYSREHILLLIFIYYFKNLLSFNDIEQLFKPITGQHFSNPDAMPLEAIYQELFSMQAGEMEHLKKDVISKYQRAQKSFQDASDEDTEYLRLFAFICELSFDVYLKKQIVEQIIDQLREEEPKKKK